MSTEWSALMAWIVNQQYFRAWPEEAPFHTPVYVPAHNKRGRWAFPGGTTFYFINDGPERAR